MVQCNGKAVCVSEGDIYLVTLKFTNEEKEIVEISDTLKTAITETVKFYLNDVKKKQKIFFAYQEDDFTIEPIEGKYGIGLLIKTNAFQSYADPSMIARGLAKFLTSEISVKEV